MALELTDKTPTKIDDARSAYVKGSIDIRTDLPEQPEIIIPSRGTRTR